jgi:hypothetical protein
MSTGSWILEAGCPKWLGLNADERAARQAIQVAGCKATRMDFVSLYLYVS